ncbi:MAG: hypothetical protein K1X83_10965 [Oligoflexia bacterium]|nr:hypothetical protein [Oligoflexia bacterium]
MEIRADFHAHIYALHDHVVALRAAIDTLCQPRGTPSLGVVCLTERSDSTFFSDLGRSRSLPDGVSVHAGAEPGVRLLATREGAQLCIIQGYQIATAERLEILGLGVCVRPADGITARAAIDQVRAQGGIAVLPWSPGKWLGKRSSVVRNLIIQHNKDELCIGATPFLPQRCSAGSLVTMARERGLTFLPGTDPFPLRGEERRLGSFGAAWTGEFDPNMPLSSLRRTVFSQSWTPNWFGQRFGMLNSGWRLLRLKLSKCRETT